METGMITNFIFAQEPACRALPKSASYFFGPVATQKRGPSE